MKLSRLAIGYGARAFRDRERSKFWASDMLRQILLRVASSRVWNSDKFEIDGSPNGLEPILDAVFCTLVFGILIEGKHSGNAERVIVVITMLTRRKRSVDCRRCVDEVLC